MEYQQVKLTDIEILPGNIRGKILASEFADLTASVKEKGVIEPILIRPNQNGKKDKKPYLLVCGERRLRASQDAKLAMIPAMVREMSDSEAAEVQLIENIQRLDIHYLREAEGFERLVKAGNSREDVSLKVGKPLSYVASRLSLAKLIAPFRKLALADKLSIRLALRLSRLTAAVQKRVHEDLFNDEHQEVTPRRLDEWVERNVMLDLSKAPFDTSDAELDKKAGACLVCPKRTGASLLFVDVESKDVCTDPECFKRKCSLVVEAVMMKAPGAAKLFAGQVQWGEDKEYEKNNILLPYDTRYGYRQSKRGYRLSKKDACESTVLGLYVAGDYSMLGKTVYVCTAETCETHTGKGSRRVAGSSSHEAGKMDPERRQVQDTIWRRRTDLACRAAIHEAISKAQKEMAGLLPVDALRHAVMVACDRIRPQKDGAIYLHKIWMPEKPQEGNDFGAKEVMGEIIPMADEPQLLRLLLDFSIADNISSKFAHGIGEELELVAKAHGIDVKALTDPIIASFDEKKTTAYKKRDAKLAKERTATKKAKEATAKPAPEAKGKKAKAEKEKPDES